MRTLLQELKVLSVFYNSAQPFFEFESLHFETADFVKLDRVACGLELIIIVVIVSSGFVICPLRCSQHGANSAGAATQAAVDLRCRIRLG